MLHIEDIRKGYPWRCCNIVTNRKISHQRTAEHNTHIQLQVSLPPFISNSSSWVIRLMNVCALPSSSVYVPIYRARHCYGH